MRQCVQLFLQRTSASGLAWLRLLGFMASMVDLVGFCSLRMQPLQLHLLAFYRPKQDKLGHTISIPCHIHPHLQRWLQEANIATGLSFRQSRLSVIITTDTSLTGWGATLPPRQVCGVWERSFQTLHINLLEMWAVVNALERFKPQISGHHVQIRCDNTTVVAYINHQGGTRSPSLSTGMEPPPLGHRIQYSSLGGSYLGQVQRSGGRAVPGKDSPNRMVTATSDCPTTLQTDGPATCRPIRNGSECSVARLLHLKLRSRALHTDALSMV